MSFQLAAKNISVLTVFAFFSLIFIGIIFASTTDILSVSATNRDISYLSWLIVAYVAGLSMIALPCTLPLVFIIIPMTMNQSHKKGLLMASLFGVGLVITLTSYGLAVSAFGKIATLDQISFTMFLVAGVAAFLFGLHQLGLVRLKMLPSFSAKIPNFIQKRGDYSKTFFMGLLLGNAGIGCPNPLFYWLLIHIASVGSLEIGGSLGLVHGVGRAIPLIMLATLAVIGINYTNRIKKSRAGIEKATGFMLVVIGAFLIIQGIPGGHEWYEGTFVHIGWNNLVSMTPIPAEFHVGMHQHEQGYYLLNDVSAPLLLSGMIVSPVVWYFMKKKNGQKTNTISIQGRNAKQSLEDVREKTAELGINNMHCKGCGSIIKTILEDTDGIIEASPFPDEKKISIRYDSTKIDLQRLKGIILDKGFDVL